MRQSFFYFSIISLMLLCACGSPTPPPIISPLPTITEPPTLTPSALIVVTAYPTLHATQTPTATRLQPTATSMPTAIPTVAAPKFSSNIYFSANEPNQSDTHTVFLPGTQQVFAMWDYANMNQTNVIRRDWYHNDELWLRREESWDLDRWGENGTVLDISIYNFESGLEPGTYRLELYIDGVAQYSDNRYDGKTFRILDERQFGPLSSPDGTHTALVLPPDTLMIQDVGGHQREFVTSGEISTLEWFPDNQHLIYEMLDRRHERVEYSGTTLSGIRHQLWVINGLTGEQSQLGSSHENLHTPVISLDGRYVATLEGSGYGDACFSDWGLTIIELDDQFGRRVLYNLDDFSGLAPGDMHSGAMPTSAPSIPGPGIWQTNTQFVVGLDWFCTFPDPRGIYQLDITTLTAEKIGDLER